jgi:hypothetical protein
MSARRGRPVGRGNITANACHLGPMIEIPPYDYFDDAKPKKKGVTLPVIDFGEAGTQRRAVAA